MNVVFIIQSGADGPVTLGTTTDRGWSRKLASLQQGNPVLLTVAHLLDGDERLERELHVRWSPYRIRGDWYKPAVLDDMPDVTEVPHDRGAETRRQALAALADLGGAG